MPNVLVVSEKEDGQKLRSFLHKRFLSLPLSMINKWCRTGQIRINSKRVKFNTKLQKNDQIRLPPFADNFKKEKIQRHFDSKILYEDSHLIAFNKKKNWSVQGGEKNILDDPRYSKLFPVHKIDAPTQGVVILAKTHNMAKKISELFKDRKIKKTYLAEVEKAQKTKKGVINSEIEVKEKIFNAETIYLFLSDKIVLLRPKTGRKHQLRRHLAEVLNNPIVGENKYNNSNKKTLHLLAFSLSFIHPETNENIKIKAEIPEWLEEKKHLIS
ncbi:MAG: RluA family pseudouridine synthase [Alphaproteobacteria bacterium]|nr:MAG: hypothetical protein B6I23_00860 [Rickettsiaceae bacterium 4572_127]